MKVLVTYASPHGSTAEVASFVGRLLGAYGLEVDVLHADDVDTVDEYDVFVMGSAVHSSMWLPSISRFMQRFEATLANRPTYLFLMCLLVLEEGGYERALRDYVWDEALERLNLPRENIEAFAGALHWNRVSGDERWLLSVNYEGKELPGHMQSDHRDWEKIAAWVHSFASKLSIPQDTFHEDAEKLPTKDETMTEADVDALKWPENPGEIASL